MNITIYEPDLRVSMECDPEARDVLDRIGDTVRVLRKKDVKIARYNLTIHKARFLADETVSMLMQKGPEVLPITMVDREIYRTGAYPSEKEFEEITGCRAISR